MTITRRSVLAGLTGATVAARGGLLSKAFAADDTIKVLPVTRGVQMWAEELNAAGGVKAGSAAFKLAVRGSDNACYTASEELKAARRAVLEDGCSFILQTYTPACRQAIASLVNDHKVLSIAYGAGYLSKDYPYLMGGVSGSPMTNMVIMSHMLEQHPEVKKVAILTNDTSFGKAGKAC